MAQQKYEQVHIPVIVTVQKLKGTKWTDQEVVNLLKIKSTSIKDVKVKSFYAPEETPA